MPIYWLITNTFCLVPYILLGFQQISSLSLDCYKQSLGCSLMAALCHYLSRNLSLQPRYEINVFSGSLMPLYAISKLITSLLLKIASLAYNHSISLNIIFMAINLWCWNLSSHNISLIKLNSACIYTNWADNQWFCSIFTQIGSIMAIWRYHHKSCFERCV